MRVVEAPAVEELEDAGPLPVGSRPEWAGAAALPPPAAARRVAAIAAAPADAEALAYFWGGVARGELSERMLALTEEIIEGFNAAHYSVWEWRWRCVEALGDGGSAGPTARAARLAAEAALTRRVATASPKNYQLWHHRRRLALAAGLGGGAGVAAKQAVAEAEFAGACLAHDAKNYHAWAHRQACAAAFAAAGAADIWMDELAFATAALERDARNNSAWAQRAYVAATAPPAALGAASQREVFEQELGYVRAALARAPHSEAAWAYLRGLASARGAPRAALAAEPAFRAACLDALHADGGNAGALALLADVYAAQAALLRGAPGGGGGAARDAAAARAAGLAAALLRKLEVADPTRAPYWRHRRAELGAGAEPLTCSA
jgi:protein farnesyltransferase/geranylgeranyltransferase type-1 subunit alpha